MMRSNLLILIRHSLPEITENIPAGEWKLSEDGRIRAQKLAVRLVSYKSKAIISSIELKAQQTAETLGNGLNLPFQIMEGLHEHERRSVPFYSAGKFQSLIQQFFERPDALVFGNETANEASLRFSQAVESVMNSHKGETVVIVTHGTVMSLFVSRLTGVDGYLFWKELGMPSYTVLDIQSKVLLKIENIL